MTFTETNRDNPPSWLAYAKGYLMDEMLGSEWTAFVESWIMFEQSLNAELSSVSNAQRHDDSLMLTRSRADYQKLSYNHHCLAVGCYRGSMARYPN